MIKNLRNRKPYYIHIAFPREEIPIGEEFKMWNNDVKLKVVEDLNIRCKKCYFDNICETRNDLPVCSGLTRTDRKFVHFEMSVTNDKES